MFFFLQWGSVMDEQMVRTIVAVIKALESKAETGHWVLGKNYFIRTVTHHLTGKLNAVTEHELWLEDAAWIADDGRFAQAVESGDFSEVEPFPSGRLVAVGRGSIIDATCISNLPRSQK